VLMSPARRHWKNLRLAFAFKGKSVKNFTLN
jgi:hypothetical protein